jgi:hypothetical protein
MGKINIVNDSDGRLTVELDGKALSPQEIFNSSDSNTNITDDANFWDLQTLGEQYDLTLEDIMAAVESYADTKNADIDYSVDELPSSVEPEAGAMSTFYENNKGRTTMNITKGRLKQFIKEELARPQVDEGLADLKKKQLSGFEGKAEEEWSQREKEIAIRVKADEIVDFGKFENELAKATEGFQNAFSAMYDVAVSHGMRSEEYTKAKERRTQARHQWHSLLKQQSSKVVEYFSTVKKLGGELNPSEISLVRTVLKTLKQRQDNEDELETLKAKGMKESKMNITKGRLKQIIQEELSRVKEVEVPEEELITVTEEELIEARHAAYYLIKSSLESGADSASLEETVRRVYGYNVPSYILELFSDEE